MIRRLLPVLVASAVSWTPVRVVAQTSISGTGRLDAETLFDSVYRRPRRVWVYTPADYASTPNESHPLIVAFDGDEYRDTVPLPRILDSLRGTGKGPAFVAVLIDDGEGATRIADLGNASKMVQFLGTQLMPWVHAHYRVSTDPHRAIITGSSAGGLAAAYVAFERPDLFGNVLSQSGAFWRGAEASNAPPYEWLTAHIAASPKRDVRFFLDVGDQEFHGTLGGAGPSIRDANRRLRDVLQSRGYVLTYTEVPGGQHAPMYWRQRLPMGISALTSGWR